MSRIEIIRHLTTEEAIAKGFIIPEEDEQMAAKRNYKKEYKDYHGTEEQKKRRAQRNRDRRRAESDGRVSKGDGKEVHHPKSRRKGRSLGGSTRVVSKAYNRKKQPKRS